MTVDELKLELFRKSLEYSKLAVEAIAKKEDEKAWEYSKLQGKYFNAEMVIDEILKQSN